MAETLSELARKIQKALATPRQPRRVPRTKPRPDKIPSRGYWWRPGKISAKRRKNKLDGMTNNERVVYLRRYKIESGQS